MISALVAAVTLLLAAAVEQVGGKRPKRKPVDPVEYPHRTVSGDEVIMVRVVYVDLAEAYKAGLLPEYEAMRDFVDRSFSVQHVDAASDLRDDQEMWISLPAPPQFQKRGAFKRLVERWPMFVDPELASLSLGRLKPVDALIQRNGGKVVLYRDLPVEAQLAVAQYMAVDGEAWELPKKFDDFWSRPGASTTKWRTDFRASLPWFVKRYGDETFGWVVVPMTELVKVVMDAVRAAMKQSRFIVDDDKVFANFDEYHEWSKEGESYENRGQPEGTSEVWPIILDRSTEEGHEPLQDGWHRFHQYYDMGLERVPAVYYP